MSLKNTLTFIKTRNKTQIKLSKHLNIRTKQRNISKDTLINQFKQEPVAIQNQEDNVYKLTYLHNNIDDLSIILKIKKENLLLITTFHESIKKRLKNEIQQKN